MIRRTTAILAAAAAISLVAVAPARAQDPSDPPATPATDEPRTAAAATATALQLTLLGQQLAVSQTQAGVGEGIAAADGAALLIAGTPVPGAAPSLAPGGAGTNEACPLALDLNEATQGALSGLELEIACVRTSASAGDLLAARAESGEVVIRVLGPGGAIIEPVLGPVLEGVTQVTDPLVEALAPLLGAIQDATQIDVPDVLDQLITAVGDTKFVLAEIVIAPSVSRAATTVDGVVADAGSNAVTINVLPEFASTLDQLTNLIDAPNVTTGPLLQVKLGAANARVVKELDGTTVKDASEAQLLSINADDSLGILGDISGQLTDVLDMLSIGELNCETGALADVLCIELGRVNDLDQAELTARNMWFGEGTAGIEAAAATVRVLPVAAAALGGDVLGLSLASTTAAANAVDVDRAIPEAPVLTSAPSLPKTGSNSALPLTLALLTVGAASAVLVRRTRTI
jgi:LPXTG-motif cell wall-anchored protein